MLTINENIKTFRGLLGAAVFAVVLIAASGSRSYAVQEANVEIFYLPYELVAAANGDNDVPVEVELVFRETSGVSVRFDQMKRTFSSPGGTILEDPLTFINKPLSAGLELHEETTLVIPANVVMICLGGLISCDLTTTLDYSGIDAQGNSVSASVDIMVNLTKTEAAETFEVGRVTLLSPEQGQVLKPGGHTAKAVISVTGIGSVAGLWLINDKPAEHFSFDSTGVGDVTVKMKIPADLVGANDIHVQLTRPEALESDKVDFYVAAPSEEPAGDAKSFSAGVFNITDVTSKKEKGKETCSGGGTAVYEPLGLKFPVKFSGLYIVRVDGKAELRAGQILAAADVTLDRGPLSVNISNVLITAGGAWADGKLTLEKSGISNGIGPIYFYALPLGEEGLKGGATLETPQKGAQGGYEATVDKYELNIRGGTASIMVSGTITKPAEPGWMMPLSISVSLGDDEK